MNDLDLNRAVKLVTEDHLESEGGYPFGYKWIDDGKLLVVAASDHDGATEVRVYTRDELRTLLATHDEV